MLLSAIDLGNAGVPGLVVDRDRKTGRPGLY